MNLLLQANTILFAQQNRWSKASEQFRQSKSTFDLGDIMLGLLILVGTVAATWALRSLLNRGDRRKVFHSPSKLFAALCAAHRLSREECRLLRRLARWQQLTDAGRLFLEPERFEPEQLGPELRQNAQALATLREKIFSG